MAKTYFTPPKTWREFNPYGTEFFALEGKRPQDAHVEGPGVPMYDPSLGRIVYVPVDWPERER